MEQNEKKKKNIIPVILGVILLIGAFFGIREYLYLKNHEDTDDAQIDGDISPVVSRVGGYVDTILFEENQHVTKGQILVKLDSRDYEIRLEQAIAAQKGANAGVGVSQSQISTSAASSSTAKANVEAARVRLWKADKDFNRYAALIKEGAITQQQFDQAKAERDAAKASFDAAEDQYKAANAQVGTTRSQLQVSNTGVDQKQADVDFAKLQLSYTTITAPASGIVSRKNIQHGQLVQAGQTLFSIVNDNSIYVTANFKETQLADMHQGQTATISVDAFGGRVLHAHVDSIASATGAKFSLLPPENATGNYVKVVQRIPVKLVFEAGQDAEHQLRPGMSTVVKVRVK